MPLFHPLQDDINNVFSGEGYRIIKSHFFARHFNLDYIWNHFPGDKIVLIYREPQKSFAWWSEVMCFDESHYPDYRPGYKNYDRMWELLWQESTKITDFAMRKGMHFYPYNVKLFERWDGYLKQVIPWSIYDIGSKLFGTIQKWEEFWGYLNLGFFNFYVSERSVIFDIHMKNIIDDFSSDIGNQIRFQGENFFNHSLIL